jgi:hypothetical protein
MHCQRKSDFPAFPVFPAESVVVDESAAHQRLGLPRRRARHPFAMKGRINDE